MLILTSILSLLMCFSHHQNLIGAQSTSPIVGIDLGTTNSVVAYVPHGESGVHIAKDELANSLIPSVVHFSDSGQIVGNAAVPGLKNDPKNTVFSIKRFLGRKFEEVKEQAENMPYTIVPDSEGYCAVCIKGKQYSPIEISSMILAHLKTVAHSNIGPSVDNAVITVPANFNSDQREMTKRAALMAGLNARRIISEPTAASMAYGLDKKKDNQNIAVFDFGGGTFDVSVLHTEDGMIDIQSTNGDNWLGGDDIDACIASYIARQSQQKLGNAALKINPAELRSIAKQTKEQLSSEESVTLDLSTMYETHEDIPREKCLLTINNDTVASACDEIYQKLLEPLKASVQEANIKMNDIDHVVMVGGSTRSKTVQELVKKYTQKDPDISVNPDEVVAFGAAIQGAILDGNKNFDDLLLLDVTPLSLGIETVGGNMKKIIKKNTTIPVKGSEIFTTEHDNQPCVLIQAFQGESEKTKNNLCLGTFPYYGIDSAPRGMPQVEVTFDIDVNGIVNVSAQQIVPTKKKSEKITISNRTGLTKEKIEEMIQTGNKEEKAKQKLTEEEQKQELKKLVEILATETANDLENSNKVWFWQRSDLEAQIKKESAQIPFATIEELNQIKDALIRIKSKL